MDVDTGRNQGPDMTLSGSQGQDVTMALGGRAGYSDHFGLLDVSVDVNFNMVSGSTPNQ